MKIKTKKLKIKKESMPETSSYEVQKEEAIKNFKEVIKQIEILLERSEEIKDKRDQKLEGNQRTGSGIINKSQLRGVKPTQPLTHNELQRMDNYPLSRSGSYSFTEPTTISDFSPNELINFLSLQIENLKEDLQKKDRIIEEKRKVIEMMKKDYPETT